MEIKQKENESLATYIHYFKREAKRCNFTNNTTTIRIFVKGLKDAHTLAARIYEKGPQTLADTISVSGETPSHLATHSCVDTILNSKCYV